MKKSLIIDLIAERIGKGLDFNVKEEISVLLDTYRSRYIVNTLRGEIRDRKFFQTSFKVEVDTKFCDDDCVVVTHPIPVPIRSNILFDYVGSPDFSHSFTWVKPDVVEFLKHSKFTGKKEKYTFLNNRLYIYNNDLIENIGIIGIFEDTDFTKYPYLKGCNLSRGECDFEELDYPIPNDLIQPIIESILKTEMSILLSKSDQRLTTDGEERTS